jgi:hypothetical protein
MPRPRVALSSEDVLSAYEEKGSLRGAAEVLCVSRWVVERRLRELRVDVRSRQDAMDLAGFIRRSRRAPVRTLEHMEIWDGTQVTFLRHLRYEPCVWPRCTNERPPGRVICTDHRAALDKNNGSQVCAWPECPQSRWGGDRMCYRHGKVLAGLMEA